MTKVSVPREECHDQLISVPDQAKDPRQITGTVAGVVIGGVLGNQVGGGSGKDIATVAGAAAGGYAGNKIQEKMQEGNSNEELQRVCQTLHDSNEEAQGYEVTYCLDGREQTVDVDHGPGSRLEFNYGQVVLNRCIAETQVLGSWWLKSLHKTPRCRDGFRATSGLELSRLPSGILRTLASQLSNWCIKETLYISGFPQKLA